METTIGHCLGLVKNLKLFLCWLGSLNVNSFKANLKGQLKF